MKSEKEPLTGISPVRGLFERSLHFKIKLIPNNNQKHEHKGIRERERDRRYTHRTCSDKTAVKDLGISPDKLLLLRRLNTNIKRPLTSRNSFSRKLKTIVRLLIKINSSKRRVGVAYKKRSFCSRPRDFGMGPLRLFK